MSEVTLSSVEQSAMQLAPDDDQLKLVEHLAKSLRQHRVARTYTDLYGTWKGQFPDSFDVDAALRDIRSAWTKRTEL